MVETTQSPKSESWRAEFERQATSNLQEKLYIAARARLRMYAGRTRHVNEADIDDMVMSVLADTLEGALTWVPEGQTLERHLLDAIAFRVRDQARSRKRHPHEVLDEDVSGETIAYRMVRGVPIGDLEVRDLKTIADQVVPEVRHRAAADPEVLLLLEMFSDGVTARADVMREAKMSCAQYDNAIRRLRRLTRQLPKQTRDAVMAELT